MRLKLFRVSLVIWSISFLMIGSGLQVFAQDEGAEYLYPHYIPDTACGVGGETHSSGSLLGLTYPDISDEAFLARQINETIQNGWSSSPWLTINGGDFGSWLVAETKARNINPLHVMSIGKQENQFGTIGRSHVSLGYNYFGMIDFGSSDPRVIGSINNYYAFANPTSGIDFFLDQLERHVHGPDRGPYDGANNIYEMMSIHQTGVIAYPPDEPFGNRGPTGIDGYDGNMRVYISWTTTDHPNDFYDGNLYNPLIYYENSVNFINRIAGSNFSTTPKRGENISFSGGVSVGCGTSEGSGLISGGGYSFPLAPQTKQIGGISVGQTESIHHDGTPAFDLVSYDSADVYAIDDGVIDRLNTNYKQQAGCTSIQFHADDGFFYWYGHLKNPTVSEGQEVVAGQKIAELADNRDFNSNCWGGAPHLHIDRGCVLGDVPQRAGRDECRDPDFIPFLSSIYAELP